MRYALASTNRSFEGAIDRGCHEPRVPFPLERVERAPVGA